MNRRCTRRQFIALIEAYGERVEEPDDIKGAFRRALNSKKPAVVEIIAERETDASMGVSLDQIIEYEPLSMNAQPIPIPRT